MRNQEARTSPKRQPRYWASTPVVRRWLVWAAALAAVCIAGYFAFAPRANAGLHPEPRPGVRGDRVQAPERYAADPQIAGVYAEVAKIPQVIDGIYCYCHCSEHHDHRSLLSCFEDDHGAQCEICLAEAFGAAMMHREGASLDEIRRVIDARMNPAAVS